MTDTSVAAVLPPYGSSLPATPTVDASPHSSLEQVGARDPRSVSPLQALPRTTLLVVYCPVVFTLRQGLLDTINGWFEPLKPNPWP